MTAELLPCPFCGDDGEKGIQNVTMVNAKRTKFNRITCRCCGAMAPELNWQQRALASEASAAPSQDLGKAITALGDALAESKGWMRSYSDAIIRDATDRRAAREQEGECRCVYATAKNTSSVRKGFEMGGYVKELCQYCQEQAEPTGIGKYIALAERCGAEVGRYEGEMVWMKFHRQSSVEAFVTGIAMLAALARHPSERPSVQQAAATEHDTEEEKILAAWRRGYMAALAYEPAPIDPAQADLVVNCEWTNCPHRTGFGVQGPCDKCPMKEKP